MNIFQDSGTDITKLTKQNYFISAVSYLTQDYLSLNHPDWTFAFVFAKWIFASNSVFSGSFVLSLYSPAVISDVSGCSWYRCFSWNKQRYGNASVKMIRLQKSGFCRKIKDKKFATVCNFRPLRVMLLSDFSSTRSVIWSVELSGLLSVDPLR